MNNVWRLLQLTSMQTQKQLDVGSVIPTVLEKIIEKLESTGMILPLVTRTSYKGGLSIPTSAVKPVATWVAEGVGSDRQKKTTGVITFNYYKLRCAVSISLEVGTTTLAAFESVLIANVTEAMVKSLEKSNYQWFWNWPTKRNFDRNSSCWSKRRHHARRKT